MRRAIGIGICAIALLIAGCSTLSGGGGEVEELHLFGLPVTLNLDTKPGPDGFAIRIFATKRGSAKGATLGGGEIEMLMFDGVIAGPDLLKLTPQQIWKFNARELRQFHETSTLGAAYRFALRWDEAPKRGHLTVIARYIPPKGEPVYSAPSTISATVK